MGIKNRDTNIVVISPSEQLTDVGARILKSGGVGFRLINAFLEEAVEAAICAERDGVRAIVTMPFTAAEIRTKVCLPVVAIETDPWGLMAAAETAQQFSSEVAYISYAGSRIKCDGELFWKHSKMNVVPIQYSRKEEIVGCVRRAVEMDIRSVICQCECVAHWSEKYGLNVVRIPFSPSSVLNALEEAVGLVDTDDRERLKVAYLQALVNLDPEGVVALDHDGRVAMLNSAAERLLNVNAGDTVGLGRDEIRRKKTLSDLLPLLYGQANGGTTVKEVHGKRLVVTRHDLSLNGRQLGSVVRFKLVEAVEELAHSVRKRYPVQGLVARHTFKDIIGTSPAIRKTVDTALKYARSDATVLITGETGVGKEIFAHAIHSASQRAKGPFVAINCAALPEQLLESELFGYNGGAFTGALREGKVGLFELANGGSIFLDEIGDLPLGLQAKLLRVIQEKEIRRIGGASLVPIDVRIIAATNANILKLVEEGKFRRDLYFRLAVLELRVLPLRERREDIVPLVEHFAHKYFGRSLLPQLPRKVVTLLLQYPWPGNVRELENFVQKAGVLLDTDYDPDLLTDYLGFRVSDTKAAKTEEHPQERVMAWDGDFGAPLTVVPGKLDAMVADIAHQLCEQRGLTKTEAARLLGISRSTLWKITRGQVLPREATARAADA